MAEDTTLGWPQEMLEGADAPETLSKTGDGVDYSERWNAALPKKLKNSGYSFAVRYIGTPGRSKSLVAPEVAALQAAGVSIVSVYEDREGTALLGYDRGAKDAKAALADCRKLGMPDGRPIYLAVDTDTTPAKVAQYFKGAIAAIGKERVGVYGGYWIIKGLADMGLATWFWQTRAWSRVNGTIAWDSRCHMRQFPLAKPFYVLGFCDLDWAMKADYGQWDFNGPKPPEPKPEPAKHRTLRITTPLMKGDDVKWVQKQLNAIKIGDLTVDGAYGPDTMAAIKRFQKRFGLVQDGICGENTWAKLVKS